MLDTYLNYVYLIGPIRPESKSLASSLGIDASKVLLHQSLSSNMSEHFNAKKASCIILRLKTGLVDLGRCKSSKCCLCFAPIFAFILIFSKGWYNAKTFLLSDFIWFHKKENVLSQLQETSILSNTLIKFVCILYSGFIVILYFNTFSNYAPPCIIL